MSPWNKYKMLMGYEKNNNSSCRMSVAEPLIFENIIDEYQNSLINLFYLMLEQEKHRSYKPIIDAYLTTIFICNIMLWFWEVVLIVVSIKKQRNHLKPQLISSKKKLSSVLWANNLGKETC